MGKEPGRVTPSRSGHSPAHRVESVRVSAEPSIRWWPAETSTDAALREQLGEGAVTGHLCASCGSDEHGAPWASLDGMRYAASASRAGGRLVTVTRLAPAASISVGVDVEPKHAAGPDPAVVLHPDERRRRGSTLDMWVRKEAILKWMGTGLDTPASAVRAADFTLERLESPPGLIAYLCLGRIR